MRILIALFAVLTLTPAALAQTGDDYAKLDAETEALFAAYPVAVGELHPLPPAVEIETPVGLQTAHAVFDDGVNFAGRYVLTTIGCGTECQAIYLLNPMAGDYFVNLVAGHGFSFRPDSRLIILNSPEELEYYGSDEVPGRLRPQCMVYQGGSFAQVGCTGFPD